MSSAARGAPIRLSMILTTRASSPQTEPRRPPEDCRRGLGVVLSGRERHRKVPAGVDGTGSVGDRRAGSECRWRSRHRGRTLWAACATSSRRAQTTVSPPPGWPTSLGQTPSLRSRSPARRCRASRSAPPSCTYPRHPAALAQHALTAQAALGGRLSLGIGLSHQIVIEGCSAIRSTRRPATCASTWPCCCPSCGRGASASRVRRCEPG
jgi:hypothetical protein